MISRAALTAAPLSLGLVSGCSDPGSKTPCDLSGCTITFSRDGTPSISVLGIEARLVGVADNQATVSVAGHEMTVPLGGEMQSNGFTVRLERLTETETEVRVSR